MNTIGEKIAKTRHERGLTQEALAEMANVNTRTIQRIESNSNRPSGQTLRLICDALELDCHDLMTEKVDNGTQPWVEVAINILFLIILNIAIMSIFGYLTLDSRANLNSKCAGVLLSFFMPAFIVWYTPHLSGLMRLLKFGFGMIVYFFATLFIVGFAEGWISMLFVCIPVFLAVLFYGEQVFRGR